MIEGLKKHGLVSTFEKGKKTLFSAENPEQLIEILTRQQNVIQSKKNKLEETLPRLLAIFNTVGDKPRVRFLEGEAPVQEILKEVARSREEVWEMYAVDEHLIEAIKKLQTDADRISVPPRTRGRALITIKPGFMLPYFDRRNTDVRILDWKDHQFTGDITVFRDHVYIFVYRGRIGAIAIQSKEIVEVIRALFEMAWSCAVAWTPPPDWEKYKLEK